MKGKKWGLVLGLGLVLLVGVIWQRSSSGESQKEKMVKERVTLFASPTCGCCDNYARYLRARGFEVEVIKTREIEAVKEKQEVPADLRSCHTGLLAGYVVEGHLPLVALKKLMVERPKIRGIALPGMPPGSPGMGGRKGGSWQIYSWQGNEQQLFMTL